MAKPNPVIDRNGNIVEFKDAMHQAAYGQLADFINQKNQLVAKANAVHGDKESLFESLTETSEDPEVVAAREARDEAIMTLHKLVTPQVESTLANAQETISEVEAQVKTIDETLRSGLGFFRKLYGDDAAKQLPEQLKIRGLKLGGSGGKRIRGFNVITEFRGETTEHENFTNAAKALGEDTSVLQSAFFEAAKVENAKDAPDVVEFTLTISEVDEDENVVELTANVQAYRPEATASTEGE